MIKTKLIIMYLMSIFSFNAFAATLPSVASFNWTYDYWVNKKYLQADNNVYKYTNGQYTARNYVNLVINSINGTETEKVASVESLTNLCYLINQNEGISVEDCLLGKLDSNVNEFLTYVVSLEYHTEQISSCLSSTQATKDTVSGRSSVDSKYNGYLYDYTKINKINNCVSLGYGSKVSPQKFLTSINMSIDTSTGQVGGKDAYSLSTISFTTSNNATTTKINDVLNDIDCEYLYKKDTTAYNLYCPLKTSTIIGRINTGLTSCSDISDTTYKSSSNKKTISERHMSGHEIWGEKVVKDVGSSSGNRYWHFYVNSSSADAQRKVSMSGRYMFKSLNTSCRSYLTGNSGESTDTYCGNLSCGTSGCYTNIQCNNAGNGSSSKVDVKYPDLNNSYFIYNAATNSYESISYRLEFNANVMNFLVNEMSKSCVSNTVSYYPIVTSASTYWFGLSDSYSNVYINNSSGEYLADPKLTGGGNDSKYGFSSPTKTATKSSYSYSACY